VGDEYRTTGTGRLGFSGRTTDTSRVDGSSHEETDTQIINLSNGTRQRLSGSAGGTVNYDFTRTNSGSHVSGRQSSSLSASALTASQVYGTIKDTTIENEDIDTTPVRDNGPIKGGSHQNWDK
jgi:hypothetical protein